MKIHFNIGGMTCINCQNKIQKALRNTKGVLNATVSYKEGTADIEYDEKRINTQKLKNVIENLDYKVLSAGAKKSPDITYTLGVIAIIAALYYVLEAFGILNNLVPSRLADTKMGYGMLFVIGLITSVHCIAMCGGIGLSQSLPSDKSETKAFLPSLLYNFGRVCSYTAIGFVLGLLGSIIGGGSKIGVPIMLQSVLKIVAGLAMAIMGINMLGIFPGLRRLTIHTPVAIARIIGDKKRASKAPFIIGMLNGLMPCGPLQAMWIVALASANPLSGALSMLMFSLGTVPLMLGLGSVVSMLGRRFTSQVMKVGAILVVVLGLAMITQGAALSGMMPVAPIRTTAPASTQAPVSAPASEEEVAETEPSQAPEGVQEVRSTLTWGSYPEITVQAGVPVRWIIEASAENITGCNSVMVIPSYGIQHSFVPGENIIEFTPTQTGTISYSCWMGMIYGRINVVE